MKVWYKFAKNKQNIKKKEKKENKKLVNADGKSTKIYLRVNIHVMMMLRNGLELVKLSVWVESIVVR